MKKERQKCILALIEQYDIETQFELTKRLSEAGFEATQATISRDIHELSLAKGLGKNKKSCYVAVHKPGSAPGDTYSHVLKEGLVSAHLANTLLVIKTMSGMAMAVAAAIDAMQRTEIIGTIAGDDTIMVAVSDAEGADRLMHDIEDIVNASFSRRE